MEPKNMSTLEHTSQVPTPQSTSTQQQNQPQQPLREALFRKQKQSLAARLGHSDILIEPLERQIHSLSEAIERLENEKDADAAADGGVDESQDQSQGSEWVVVKGKRKRKRKRDEKDQREEEAGETVQPRATRAIKDVDVQAGEDGDKGVNELEKILGTWI